MTTRDQARPGDILLAIHDFIARSSDELSLARGDRIELIERDDDFGDGWFLGKHLQHEATGLFPEVYTTIAPRGPRGFHSAQRSNPINHAVNPAVTAAVAATNGAVERNAATPAPLSTSVDPSVSQFSQQAVRSSPVELPTSTSPTSLSTDTMPIRPASSGSASATRPPHPSAAQRNSAFANQTSPVMHETLSVIDEHITDMNTPRGGFGVQHERGTRMDSGNAMLNRANSRLSYINGQETDEEESNVLTEAEVSKWSASQVAEYLEDVGVDKDHCDIFKEQEITGEVLLGMDQSSIFLKEFDLGPIGRRLRTWHKIKNLQNEVNSTPVAPAASDYSANEELDGQHRARTMSAGSANTLPRIPGLMDGRSSRSSSLQHAETQHHPRQPSRGSTTPLPGASSSHAGDGSPRPSAASVRNINHSRRHSSIDGNGIPNISTIPSVVKTSPSKNSHTTHSSFDRSWTMTGSKQTQPSSVDSRPLSSSHTRQFSNDGSIADESSEQNLAAPSQVDLDRGYFSGGEVDNRKFRNMLKKKEEQSGVQGKRRSGTFGHLRMASTDSARDTLAAIASPASKMYHSATFRKSSRTISGSDLAKTASPVQDVHPAVTKLEYGNSHSIDAIASSPHLADSETSSLDRPSPASGQGARAIFPKTRATGLRAISDAVTGNERSLAATEKRSSGNKDSPIQSPSTRTGSSTPSGTSKSFEIDPDTSLPVLKSPTSNSGGLAPTSRRAKTKKQTSAYTRGLEKKPPQETIPGCDYSGWMKKRSSNLMTTWKPRLFVLRGRRLSYYYSENDTEEKGLIDISSHRVLPANDERLTGLHATLTGATTSPTSPNTNMSSPNPNAITTTADADAAKRAQSGLSNINEGAPGMFIFKLVPPRQGLSKAVNFTKPTVHYFAVDSVQIGRLWMAALMKATIEREESTEVVTTYNQRTISLAKARAMRQRPPALMGTEEEEGAAGLGIETGENGDAENNGNGQRASVASSSARAGAEMEEDPEKRSQRGIELNADNGSFTGSVEKGLMEVMA
ncbi:hypothetical protein K402DRAFT_419352 [Aulographum hederae CBS 113979]|uniref:Polarized growth protein Boi2 n=1 Tax=Aulographum hederae CBS 113979 TaxID=1176131 RepID=A0A6G1H616_9PEZI|nr:hypothetical protein K402DRAFT_419352 [Aulographum hederae CBS 113979]